MTIKNTISVTVNKVNGEIGEILDNATPKLAIDNYFYPDAGVPVSSLIIKAKTADGKSVTLIISNLEINLTID